MTPNEVDSFAKLLGSLTVRERAYAYHAYMLFVEAAKQNRINVADQIFGVSPKMIAALPLGGEAEVDYTFSLNK